MGVSTKLKVSSKGGRALPRAIETNRENEASRVDRARPVYLQLGWNGSGDAGPIQEKI
jgi:hypothetical protein